MRRIYVKVGRTAQPRRLVAGRAGKSHWLATVSGRWEARSAIEVTGEPPATVSWNQGGKNPGWVPTDRATGFYRDEGWGREGYPIEIEEERRERTIEDNVPVQHWCRCGSTPVLNLVGMGAEVGRSDPAAEHDSNMRLMVSMRGPSRASSRRITPGFILRHGPPPAR